MPFLLKFICTNISTKSNTCAVVWRWQRQMACIRPRSVIQIILLVCTSVVQCPSIQQAMYRQAQNSPLCEANSVSITGTVTATAWNSIDDAKPCHRQKASLTEAVETARSPISVPQVHDSGAFVRLSCTFSTRWVVCSFQGQSESRLVVLSRGAVASDWLSKLTAQFVWCDELLLQSIEELKNH